MLDGTESQVALASPILQNYGKRRVITKKSTTMEKKIKEWMGRNNMTFSAICGETFTNAEVVYTHIGLVVFLIVLGIAGTLS